MVMVPPAPDTLPGELPGADYLIFRLATEHYALAGSSVREVIRWRVLTPVPGSPPALPGIFSQRGQVLPVADLRVILGLPATPPERATRLVLTYTEQADLVLIVDAVIDLAPLDPNSFAPPPSGLEPQRARLISGIARHAGEPLAVLNIAALIAVLQEVY